MADDVALVVNGSAYAGFMSGSVRLSMEEAADSFRVEYADRWSNGVADVEPWPIEEGDECAIRIGDDDVVIGYVDEVQASYSADEWTLSASGRSKTADLIDCAAMHRGHQWNEADLVKIATDLCEPFGIGVFAGGSVEQLRKRFPKFKYTAGETCIEVISRAARMRGLIPMADGENLALFEVGSNRTATVLRRGDGRVMRGSRDGSWSERFSEYHFCGQTQATDDLYGLDASELAGEVQDRQVRRYRPMVLVGRSQRGKNDLGKRAVLERNLRAGQSERLTYVLDGYRDDAGVLWEPNTLVRVVDDWLRVSAVLLIVSVEYRFGPDEPRSATLTLTRPEAFDTEDYPARGRGDRWE